MTKKKVGTPRSPRVMVAVTTEHIAEAVPRDSGHCMIAEAVKSAYPGAGRVSVDLQTIRFSDYSKGVRYTYLTPRVAQVALIQFDQGIRPEPIGFTLRQGLVTRAGRSTGGAKAPDVLAKSDLRLEGSTSSIRRVGGRTPPVGAIGARRSFGLRSLDL